MDEFTVDGLTSRNRRREAGATQSRAPARDFVLGLSLALAVTGCGGGSGSSGSDNRVAAAVSPSGTVSTYIDKTQTVTITFTTNDGAAATALNVAGLMSLPAGWSASSASFSCASVSTDRGCALTLSYAPTDASAGTLNLAFNYKANNGAAKSGSFSVPYSAQPPTLASLAGSIGGGGNLDGTGTAARFSFPSGVAVASDGTVYVADGGNRIRKVTPDGVVTTLAGSAGICGAVDGPVASASFCAPSAIAMAGEGTLYVADTGNSTIRKISPQGVVTTLAGTPYSSSDCRYTDGVGAQAAFCLPRGIAVDTGGTVYVADTFNSLIREIAPNGAVSTLAGTLFQSYRCISGPGQTCPPCPKADGTGAAAGFCAPTGIAVGADGMVFVGDAENDLIRKVTPAGVVTTLPGFQGSVWGLAIDSTSTLYLANYTNFEIQTINSQGVVATLANTSGLCGTAGASPSECGPTAVAVDSNGSVYASVHNEVRKVSPQGVVTTLAGLGENCGHMDGSGASATFCHPVAVAVDRKGTAYVADSFSEVRTVSPQGVVKYLAGNPDSCFGVVLGSPTDGFCGLMGIAIDNTGAVYVTDGGTNTIKTITMEGVITTLAGAGSGCGATDGAGTSAMFCGLAGIAIDGTGTLYVADYGNDEIRKISPQGVVTTLAGSAGTCGSADGTGASATFCMPKGVAVDAGGTVYVADSSNNTIRKISPQGVVTTLAGTAGTCGSEDGTGAAASFCTPVSLAVDSGGTLYVVESTNPLVRKITPQGVVTTLIGSRLSFGIEPGSFPASLGSPSAVAVRPDGQIVIADTDAILVTVGL